MTDVPDVKVPGAQVERWLNLLGSVIAPATLVGALLFYFGYVSSRAQYDYFGIDVDLIGLSTQDYVMRSPQPLLVPLLVFTLLGAGLVMAHGLLRRRAAEPWLPGLARRAVVVGLGLVGLGVVLLFGYPWLTGWDLYALVTPMLLAAGGALVAYALSTLRFLVRQAPTGRPAPRLGVIALVWAAVAACLFWATATVAQWSGLGLAQHQANNLDDLPSVIIDTQERLFLPEEAAVSETALPGSDEADYRFRYWGLRLLIVGDDQLYLVPNDWNAHNTTLVVPNNDSVRVQFQFRNVAP